MPCGATPQFQQHQPKIIGHVIGEAKNAVLEIIIWHFIGMQICFPAAVVSLSWRCVPVKIVGSLLQLFKVKIFHRYPPAERSSSHSLVADSLTGEQAGPAPPACLLPTLDWINYFLSLPRLPALDPFFVRRLRELHRLSEKAAEQYLYAE